jgi:hypothetical protein
MAIAVVTGAHPIDVRGFQEAIECSTGSACVFQSLYEFGTDSPQARAAYDLVIFYHWHLPTPLAEPDEWWQRGTREALEGLGNGQGMIILHHSLVAFPEWDTWDLICGYRGRGNFTYHQDQIVHVELADPEHPITRGMSDFTIEDEVYSMRSPDPSMVTPILTTRHEMSMSTLAWAHMVKQSRVFCLQLGHGPTAYAHPSFREILGRASSWVCEES